MATKSEMSESKIKSIAPLEGYEHTLKCEECGHGNRILIVCDVRGFNNGS